MTRADHLANGPEVATVRHFLGRHEKATEGDEILAVTDGATLTATALRTLLDEHDTYRTEARTARTQDPGTTLLPDSFLNFIESCITGDEHSIKDPDIRPSVLSHGAYNSGWDVLVIWDECQAKRKIVANYRAAARQRDAARELAALDARYPSVAPERGEHPSDAYLDGRLVGAYHALMAIACLYQGRPGYRRALKGDEPTS